MKKTLSLRFVLLFAVLQSAAPAWTQGVTTPRTASPAATVSQTIGISKVSVEYSRPSVKGRAIWGELVPYGWNIQNFGSGASAPWRAGANENTVFTVSHAVRIEDKTVVARSAALLWWSWRSRRPVKSW